MNFLPGPVFIKDKKNRLIFCNNHFASLLHSTPEKLINSYDNNCLPDDLKRQYEKENYQVIEQGKVVKSQSVYPTKGEDRIWIPYKFPISTGSETLIGRISMDLGDKRKVKDELRKSLDEQKSI